MGETYNYRNMENRLCHSSGSAASLHPEKRYLFVKYILTETFRRLTLIFFSSPTPYEYLIFYNRHNFSHSPKLSIVHAYSTCFPNTYMSLYRNIDHSHYLYVVQANSGITSQTRPRPLPSTSFTFKCSNRSKIQCHVIVKQTHEHAIIILL